VQRTETCLYQKICHPYSME